MATPISLTLAVSPTRYAPGTFNLTGTLTFDADPDAGITHLYMNGVEIWSAEIIGTDTQDFSVPITANSGMYTISAHYDGSGTYDPADSNDVPITIISSTQRTYTVTLTSSEETVIGDTFDVTEEGATLKQLALTLPSTTTPNYQSVAFYKLADVQKITS